MKKKKMLAILALMLGLVGSASAALVAHYQFEGNANDSTVNGLDGVMHGGAGIVIDPERGNVLSLAWDGDYVDCGYDTLFDITDSITVAAWIKVDSFNKSYQALVAKGNETWKLTRSSQNNSMAFFCNFTGIGDMSVRGQVNVNDGQWHHVAGVYDGSTIALYVDSVLDKSEFAWGTINTDTSRVLIGQNFGWPGRWWLGLVDDVRIYDDALNAAEIADVAMDGTGTDAGGGVDYDWIISGNNMYSGVSGNVGIGTSSPNARLDVASAISPVILLRGPSFDTGTIGFYKGSDWMGQIGYGDVCGSGLPGLDEALGICSYTGTATIGTVGRTTLFVRDTGNVGIGQVNPGSHRLYVNGTIYASQGYWVSDLQFKKNIKTIDSPIDKINNIRGVSFEWKRSEYQDKGLSEGEHYGVIAQEIEQVLPEIVKEGPNGDKAVSYIELIPILTEAIKEQQKQLEEQQRQIEYLLQRVESLERIVQQ